MKNVKGKMGLNEISLKMFFNVFVAAVVVVVVVVIVD